VGFIFLTDRTLEVPTLVFAMAGFGFMKGLYDANIWAGLYDFVPAERRGPPSLHQFDRLAGGGRRAHRGRLRLGALRTEREHQRLLGRLPGGGTSFSSEESSG